MASPMSSPKAGGHGGGSNGGVTDVMLSDLSNCIDALFIFALIWSVGAALNENGRKIFHEFLMHEMSAQKFPWPFPSDAKSGN